MLLLRLVKNVFTALAWLSFSYRSVEVTKPLLKNNLKQNEMGWSVDCAQNLNSCCKFINPCIWGIFGKLMPGMLGPWLWEKLREGKKWQHVETCSITFSTPTLQLDCTIGCFFPEFVVHCSRVVTSMHQVLSLTQFYSVVFLQSWVSAKKCVFHKVPIEVCLGCSRWYLGQCHCNSVHES